VVRASSWAGDGKDFTTTRADGSTIVRGNYTPLDQPQSIGNAAAVREHGP
jgi:hypothetical protein